MQTFTVQHAVDFSSGTAKIGKCHILEKREDVMAASYAERIEKMHRKKQNKGNYSRADHAAKKRGLNH